MKSYRRISGILQPVLFTLSLALFSFNAFAVFDQPAAADSEFHFESKRIVGADFYFTQFSEKNESETKAGIDIGVVTSVLPFLPSLHQMHIREIQNAENAPFFLSDDSSVYLQVSNFRV